MKKLLLALFVYAGGCSAQATLQSNVSPSPVRPGQTTTVSIALSGSPSGGIAGLQWTLTLPAGFTAGMPTLAPAVAAIPKQLVIGGAVSLVFDFNVLPIPNGLIATVPVTVPAGALPSNGGPVTLTNVVAASPAGVSIPITAGNSSIAVLDVFDVNGDGSVTTADVNAIVSMVAAGNCTFDVVGNGQCNVLQVIAEVIAWDARGRH